MFAPDRTLEVLRTLVRGALWVLRSLYVVLNSFLKAKCSLCLRIKLIAVGYFDPLRQIHSLHHLRHNRQKVWVEVISLLFDFDKTVKIVL